MYIPVEKKSAYAYMNYVTTGGVDCPMGETSGSQFGPRNQSPLDIVLDALANKYRRRILFSLLEHNPQDDTELNSLREIAVEDDDLEHLELVLTHTHLPKLEEYGFIEWDWDNELLRRGPRFEEIEPLLQLMHDHADERPEGWL